MENFKVHKIMINSGNVANVLFYDMLFRMKIPKETYISAVPFV